MTGAQDQAAIARKISDWTRALGAKDANAVSQFFTKDVVTFDLARHDGGLVQDLERRDWLQGDRPSHRVVGARPALLRRRA
jgi:hypothetical protein